MNNTYYHSNLAYTRTVPVPPIYDSSRLFQNHRFGYIPSQEMFGANPWMRDRIPSYNYWNEPMSGYQNYIPLYRNYGHNGHPALMPEIPTRMNPLSAFHTTSRVPYTAYYADQQTIHSGARNSNLQLSTPSKSSSQNVKEVNGKTKAKASEGGNKKDPKGLAYKGKQIIILEAFFGKSHYPTRIQKVKLALQLGLSESQVKVWFQNRRSKYRKETASGSDGNKPVEGCCHVHDD